MEKVVNKTVNALTRLGNHLERRLSTGNDDEHPTYESYEQHEAFASSGSAFHRPLDKKPAKSNYASRKSNKFSSDNLAASPSGSSSFNNYRQIPIDRLNRPPYGTGIGAPLAYGYQGASGAQQFGGMSGDGQYGGMSGGGQFGGMSGGGQFGGMSGGGQLGNGAGNVGYAPDYYIAERRQLELVPAPKPQIIRQEVRVPYPVDRPVPQPYAVKVPQPYPVDRPVRVPVPQPYPVDRPVPYPVAVQSPPVQVPVPVPTPVPCYIPVPVPVPSPPPSPVMVENSVTYTQRWIQQDRQAAGSPQMFQQQRQMAGSPLMFQQNQQRQMAGSPVMFQQNQQQQRQMAGSPMMFQQNQQPQYSGMGMNPCCLPYGSGAYQ
ncbi:unnamed protein product [Adineta steineri]|uniref:Uncharacterized protein n=1 Tax=Adineta steineri TaxID=433720 RepID=A0A813QU27_9BILA|nr:unnamed protein product [Adineta steineri]CAF3558354.1 unnamed protein product [Adineta steineri]